MQFKHSNEAFWWSLFSAGGVMSALFLPALIVSSGLVLPARSLQGQREFYEHLYGLVGWWPVRVLLFVVIFLSFFHAAHRIRHIVIDLGWRHRTAPLSVLCYGGAMAGMAFTAYVLVAFGAPGS